MFWLKVDESDQGQVVCVDGGRLQRYGKSNRSEAPPDGHRSDSQGIVDQFPAREFDSSIIKKTFAGRINPVLFLSNFSFLYMLFYVIV